MSASPNHGRAAAARVIETYFSVPGRKDLTGLLAFDPIPPRRSRGRVQVMRLDRALFTDDASKAADFIREFLPLRKHVFVTPATYTRAVRSRDAASGTVALFCDVDLKCFAGRTSADRTTNALAAVKAFPIPPTWIADTGHGFQPQWVLKAHHATPDDAARARVEAVLQGIGIAVGGTAKKPLDEIGDLGRMLRVPGSRNVKDKTRPVATSLVEFEPSRRYTLADFGQYEKLGREHPARALEIEVVGSGVVESVRQVADSERIAVRVEEMEKDATIRALLRGRAGPVDATPSEIDRLLVEAALVRGMTEDDELSDLLLWRLSLSERTHRLTRGKYVQKTIDAARAAMFIRLRKAIDPLRDLAQI